MPTASGWRGMATSSCSSGRAASSTVECGAWTSPRSPRRSTSSAGLVTADGGDMTLVGGRRFDDPAAARRRGRALRRVRDAAPVPRAGRARHLPPQRRRGRRGRDRRPARAPRLRDARPLSIATGSTSEKETPNATAGPGGDRHRRGKRDRHGVRAAVRRRGRQGDDRRHRRGAGAEARPPSSRRMATSTFVRTDIAEPASAQAAVDATVERFGHVDILVNNAGDLRRLQRRRQQPRVPEAGVRREPARAVGDGQGRRPADGRAAVGTHRQRGVDRRVPAPVERDGGPRQLRAEQLRLHAVEVGGARPHPAHGRATRAVQRHRQLHRARAGEHRGHREAGADRLPAHVRHHVGHAAATPSPSTWWGSRCSSRRATPTW